MRAIAKLVAAAVLVATAWAGVALGRICTSTQTCGDVDDSGAVSARGGLVDMRQRLVSDELAASSTYPRGVARRGVRATPMASVAKAA